MIVSSMLCTSFCWKVMSAFSCSPKISGESLGGNFLMYSMYDSLSPSGGAEYLKRASSCEGGASGGG
jgi:hypothetical protein